MSGVVDSLAGCSSRRTRLAALQGAVPGILPSLLLCDFGNLEREVGRLEAAGVAGLHLDVMDGHFVPNLTYGPPIVEAVRRLTRLPLDVHLMISRPERYLENFCQAGADVLTIHAEAVSRPRPVLERIRRLGAAAGLAIKPGTPVAAIRDCLGSCDLVLVMSVEPGFGGQQFEPVSLEKLRALAGEDVLLEIDGGVNESTIERCAEAGAQLHVVGSAIFRSDDYAATVARLTKLARNQRGG